MYIDLTFGKKLFDAGIRFIRCEVVLSQESEREKHSNPLEVHINTSTVIQLTELPIKLEDRKFNDYLISTEDSILINSLIYKNFLASKKQEFLKLEESLKVEVEDNIQEAKQVLNEARVEHDNLKIEILQARDNYQEIKNNKARLEDSLRDLYLLQTDETEKFALLQADHEKAEQYMSMHLDRLKSYIEDKATMLKQLGFVDAEEFELAFGDHLQNAEHGEKVSFEQVLGRDYGHAVSYIQAYLLDRDILYPRHVLENFFTLLRTNDLIVLAGDSGSGKTNLVQSFAKAIGGVAKIIPVKPNWTSSEDLLGYYNPLDKKYLSAPFLDALIDLNQQVAPPITS
jgi:hypothetical protein